MTTTVDVEKEAELKAYAKTILVSLSVVPCSAILSNLSTNKVTTKLSTARCTCLHIQPRCTLAKFIAQYAYLYTSSLGVYPITTRGYV